jgi:tetratricopeptide (TPR) repeat protein
MRYWGMVGILLWCCAVQAQTTTGEQLLSETRQLPNMPATIDCYVGADAFERHLEEAALRTGQQRLAEAYPHYQCATQLKPASWLTWRGLGVVLLNFSNYDTALQVFEYAIQLNPQESSLYYYRGYVESQLDNDRAALLSLTRAIELNPNYTIAYNWRGVVYQKVGEFEKALQDLKVAATLGYPSPRHTPFVNLGNLYRLHYQDPREALFWFLEAARVSPEQAFLYEIIGDLYFELGDYTEAEYYYSQYVRLMNQAKPNILEVVQLAYWRQMVLRYLPTLLILAIVAGYAGRWLWQRGRERLYRGLLWLLAPNPPNAA